MGRSWVTGDTHAFHDMEKVGNFAHKELDFTLDDVLIIAGDAGFIWYKDNNHPNHIAMCEFLNELPFTVFVVLGNHENYDKIEKLEIIDKFNSKVKWNPETPNVFYAERGNIYTINNKTFWCFGGGYSIDKAYRTNHLSWWEQEEPNISEYFYGVENLDSYNATIDYIITHDAPSNAFDNVPRGVLIGNKVLEEKEFNNYLKEISLTTYFKHWFCGHYHFDGDFDFGYKSEDEAYDKISFLYQRIIMIGDE